MPTNIKISITITSGDGQTNAIFTDERSVESYDHPHNAKIWVQTLTGLESALSKVHAKLFPDEDAALTAPSSPKHGGESNG